MEFYAWETILLTFLMATSIAIFVRGLWARVKLITRGHSDRARTEQLNRRLWWTFREVIFQTRVIQGRPLVGLMHATVFGGFLFFFFETIDHFLKPYGLHPLHVLPPHYLLFYKNLLSGWAVLVSISILSLAFRRFVLVKSSPDRRSYSSGLVALFILLLMGTFLYLQWEKTSSFARINWWLHASIILVFPHLILRSKHLHIILAPINIFFRTQRLGELKPLNLDLEFLETDHAPFGLETIRNLSWKQRLDFLSCVECGRCTDHCPAHMSGQELDPRQFILNGQQALFRLTDSDPVVGNIISETALGQCTSCGACEAVCPVGIEHLQVLVGAKRAQALASGTGMVATDFLQSVERAKNAFGSPEEVRRQLITELNIPYFQKGESEYLLWLGCVWGHNRDARPAVESMVKILRSSGVRFGVLSEEVCSGHHSRRQGEEMQFQSLAKANLKNLKSMEPENIITPCPHCLHTIGREYPALDLEFDARVIHHSELLDEFLKKKTIRLDVRKSRRKESTYHDPCYLGRYEKIFEAPRRVMAAAGLKVLEMDRNRERAVCCGGGNAGFMREPKVSKRVDQIRGEQVRQTGAKWLVTACPECTMMLKTATEETKDLAEILAEVLVEDNEPAGSVL